MGKEALTQMTPHVPFLRTMSGTLAVLGMASTTYAIGPGRIYRFIRRSEGKDKLSRAEIVALTAMGVSLGVWGALWVIQEYQQRNWNPQQRAFSEKDYLDDAKRNMDRWVKPKMTLKNPLAPIVGDSFVEKCVDKLTFTNQTVGYPYVVADIKWDPSCWHSYTALNMERYDDYLQARDTGSFSWGEVPIGKFFREIVNGRRFYIPRFLNPSWEDMPNGGHNDVVALYLRKPEACSMEFSWENSVGKYSIYRDVINQHGRPYDYCDLTDRSTWPDATKEVAEFYRKNCQWLTKKYPGHPVLSVPECKSK